MRRVLVLDQHGFGNVVMSLPLLHALSSAKAPHQEIFVLFKRREYYALAEANGLRIEPLYLREGSMLSALRSLRRRLGGPIDLLLSVPQIPIRTATVFRLLVGARFAVGEATLAERPLLSAHVDKDRLRSILTTQRQLLDLIGVEPTHERPVIQLTAEERDDAAQQLLAGGLADGAPIVGIQASAEKDFKRWPASRFAEVVETLRASYPQLGVVSFGSSSDREAARTVRRNSSVPRWLEGAGQWSIRKTAALLQRCSVFVSGDTGLMHMAAAVGTPTVSIFGATSPLRLSPPVDHTALWPQTPCHPCYEKWGYRSCRCIQKIGAGAVAATAAAVLSMPRKSPSPSS